MKRTRLIERPNGSRCPDCGGPVIQGEGSVRCAICGFTRRRR
jgi:uncharacterized Zn finger protein (UPF0148 family)